jgi:hypothetical protein
MNKRVLALLAVALAIGVLLLVDRPQPDSGVVEPVERAARAPAAAAAVAPLTESAAVRPAVGGKAGSAEPAILRLVPRAELVGGDDEAIGGDAVFGMQNWNPPQPAPPAQANVAPPPPPPPMAPPLPFTYLGKANEAGRWEVYLSQGEKTYVVKAKETIDGVYRVDAIAPPTLTLTYLPLNQVQTLNIGVLD